MYSRIFKLLVVSFTLLSISIFCVAEKRVALVIGNSNYRDPLFPSLSTPVNDAREIGNKLYRLGFDTIMLVDGNRTQMLDAISRFEDASRNADVGVFFYSGHGANIHYVNYLVPCESVFDMFTLVDRCIHLRTITELMERNCVLSFSFIDACRSEVSFEEQRQTKAIVSPSVILRKNHNSIPAGSMICYATEDGKTATTGNGKLSPFTASFSKYLGDDREFREVWLDIQQDVIRQCNEEIPQSTGVYTNNFYFNRKDSKGTCLSSHNEDTTNDKFDVNARRVLIEEGVCGANIHYYLFDDGTLNISGSGDMTNYSDSLQSPFEGRYCIRHVNLEPSISSIGSCSFRSCYNLETMSLPNTLITIGEKAFSNCGLSELVVPNSVTTIDKLAFLSCSRLKMVLLPSSVHKIEGNIFQNCASLSSIMVDPNNSVYDSRNNCNAIIQKEGHVLIAGCKSIIIPNSIQCIGPNAFIACNIDSLIIPNSVDSISNMAFYGCSNIESIIVLPGNNTFMETSSNNVLVNKKTHTLVRGCKNSVIPFGVTTIGFGAFSYCKEMKGIGVPNSVHTIDALAFAFSDVESLNLPNSVSIIENAAFFQSHLKILKLSNSLTAIGRNAFYSCYSLTSMSIPKSVTYIGAYSFGDCYALKSIILPRHLKLKGILDDFNLQDHLAIPSSCKILYY